MPSWLFILALGALFAVADRFAGGDYITNIRKAIFPLLKGPPWLVRFIKQVLNARTFVWAGLALVAPLMLLGVHTRYGLSLAILSPAFMLWRCDGWTAFGGSIDPKTVGQEIGLLERQLLAVPAFAPAIGFLDHGEWLWAFVLGISAMIFFALWAAFLGVLYGKNERPGIDLNAYVELARGFGLGALAGVALVFGA